MQPGTRLKSVVDGDPWHGVFPASGSSDPGAYIPQVSCSTRTYSRDSGSQHRHLPHRRIHGADRPQPQPPQQQTQQHYGTCAAATTADRAARDATTSASGYGPGRDATECTDKNPPGNETVPNGDAGVPGHTTVLVNQPGNGPQSVAELSTQNNKDDEPKPPEASLTTFTASSSDPSSMTQCALHFKHKGDVARKKHEKSCLLSYLCASLMFLFTLTPFDTEGNKRLLHLAEYFQDCAKISLYFQDSVYAPIFFKCMSLLIGIFLNQAPPQTEEQKSALLQVCQEAWEQSNKPGTNLPVFPQLNNSPLVLPNLAQRDHLESLKSYLCTCILQLKNTGS
ncbi:hypothetical protein Pelo_15909 [Pelomyxa schiedti]|nr:hypothetical protein Pelo_15909 [Pelomyxa schiedti]